MRTALVSDLHLGSAAGEDLLRSREIRERLLERLTDTDRLILLGDTLELRDLPIAAVVERAEPFFQEVGTAMAGREVVLVPGNHDHRLLAAWHARRVDEDPLGLEQRIGVMVESPATW